MVFLSRILLQGKSARRGRTFVDKLRIYVRGGGGGQGHTRFGGHGGRGGHVYVVGDATATLGQLQCKFPRKRFTAPTGSNSSKRGIFAQPGEDINIPVPTGIEIKTDAGRLIGEIHNTEDRVLVASGGAGGSPQNRYLGSKGDAQSMTLDLKLIADIGLVGFPNAGKSTLLSALSRASPKIASYPFTTIQPQLGTMEFEDLRQITVADLPGLIEGAHINIGMGHSFLKHVERTSLLLFVVDVQGFRLSAKHELRTALQTILLLNKELELYREDLIDKPAVLALNKVDLPGSDQLADDLINALRDGKKCVESIEKQFRPNKLMSFDDVVIISAKQQQNIESLKERLRKLLDYYEELSREDTLLDKNDIERRLMDHRGAKLV